MSTRLNLHKIFTGMAVFLATITTSLSASALAVNTSDDGTFLADEFLGSQVTIDAGSITYSGAGTNASGTFTDGLSSGIGIESGIILTTGNAQDAVGPNTGDGYDGFGASTELGLAGDADLDGFLTQDETFDAIILEFDIILDQAGDLFFNFAFASEEYNEYVNTEFNDVFGLFIDGTNLALLDDGVTPVSINTVNGGNPFGTNASNPDLFNNNDLDDGGPFFDLQYDGFTDVLQVTALGLEAGTHTIRLAIADAGDERLDSALFIEAGVIEQPPAVPEPATMALTLIGLAGLGIQRYRRR